MKKNSSWDLEGPVLEILKFRADREWEKFHKPKELATAIAIESGELQELFLWRADENSQEVKTDQVRLEKIKDEISDIAIYLLYLSNDLELDLSKAIIEKTKKNVERFPIELFKGKYEKNLNIE